MSFKQQPRVSVMILMWMREEHNVQAIHPTRGELTDKRILPNRTARVDQHPSLAEREQDAVALPHIQYRHVKPVIFLFRTARRKRQEQQKRQA